MTKPGFYLRPVEDRGRFAGFEIVRIAPDGSRYFMGWEESLGASVSHRRACTRAANARARSILRSKIYAGQRFHGVLVEDAEVES